MRCQNLFIFAIAISAISCRPVVENTFGKDTVISKPYPIPQQKPSRAGPQSGPKLRPKSQQISLNQLLLTGPQRKARKDLTTQQSSLRKHSHAYQTPSRRPPAQGTHRSHHTSKSDGKTPEIEMQPLQRRGPPSSPHRESKPDPVGNRLLFASNTLSNIGAGVAAAGVMTMDPRTSGVGMGIYCLGALGHLAKNCRDIRKLEEEKRLAVARAHARAQTKDRRSLDGVLDAYTLGAKRRIGKLGGPQATRTLKMNAACKGGVTL